MTTSIWIFDGISPGSFEDGEDPPTYSAVSYTWGDLTRTYTIQLNNQPFIVHHNLRQMLHDLRIGTNRRKRNRWLWIDAICIDQSNKAEKSRQIPKMSKIYSHAETVIVWLGPGTPEADLALLPVIKKHYTISMPSWHNDAVMTYAPENFIDPGGKDKDLMKEKYLHALGASVVSTSWWERLWGSPRGHPWT